MSNRKLIVAVLVILSVIDLILLWTDGPAKSAALTPEYADTDMQRPENPDPSAPQSRTVRIRTPESVIDELSAAGTVDLISKRQVVLEVDGTISQINVKVGDWVAAGDLLLALDTAELQRSVARAEVDVASAEADLVKLQQGSDPGEITVAEANLAAAKENLIKVQSGAAPEDLAAAQAKVAAAQAKLNGLFAPPSSGAIDEAKAELAKAEIARKEAQREYDKIKWRNDIGMTPESAALQKATIDFERAQGKFNSLNVPSSAASVQEAKSDVQRAVSDLQTLQNRPSAVEVAEAQAKVQDAEQKLNKLNAGASGPDLLSAQAKVEKAKLDLEEAQAKLQRAQVTAPIEGAVLEVNVTAGERGTVGKTVITLADVRQLKLTVKVAEVDIPQIALGQAATIAIDAIRGRTFTGVVEQIDPINKADKDVVNYPVTIRLTDSTLDGVRPGMNAVANFPNQQANDHRWLVPTTALQTADNQSFVQVVRGEQMTQTPVTPVESQGEWTIVQSEALQAGDEVLGQVASYVNDQQDVTVSY
jgi:HlyD family secretion protein